MGKYTYIEKFTLIPDTLYTPELGKEILMQQFHLDSDIQAECCNPGHSGVVIAYCNADISQVSDAEKLSLPLVVGVMDVARAAEEYNKVAFHYSKERGFAHIVIYMGEELKLANSFKVDSFESALYFLFLSIKGLQMNPQQCVINLCWNIDKGQMETVAKFFKGARVADLDIDLIK